MEIRDVDSFQQGARGPLCGQVICVDASTEFNERRGRLFEPASRNESMAGNRDPRRRTRSWGDPRHSANHAGMNNDVSKRWGSVQLIQSDDVQAQSTVEGQRLHALTESAQQRTLVK